MQNFDTLFKSISPNKYAENIFQNLFYEEANAFLQSAFQSQVLLAHNISLGITLESISQADQSHFSILGKSITLLGGKPLLKTASQKFFSGRNICPYTNAQDILLEDITIKEKSVIAYKSAMLKIQTKPLKQILHQILLQEEHHLEILKNVIENFKSQSK